MMKILIVDDHILFRQGLISLLNAEADVQVCGEAGSLKEAIRLSCELKPDIILMDFELPDGTGVEATQAILKDNPSCYIVFMTVFGDDEKLFRAIRSGAVGYLLKSTPFKELMASLQAVYAGEAALSAQMTRRLMVEFSHTERSDRSDNTLESLTRREKEILRELMLKSTNQEIAAKLFINENTVKHHIHSIFNKLEIHSRREAAKYAKKYGLN